jgi:hypothetical protein
MDFEVTLNENRIEIREIREINDNFVKEVGNLTNEGCLKKLKGIWGLRPEMRWIAKIEYTVLMGILQRLGAEPELQNCLDTVEEMQKWLNSKVPGDGGFRTGGEL